MNKTAEKLTKSVGDDLRFIKSWLRDPKAIGSIKPTSKAAARLMVSTIPKDSTLPILELGAGTGIITSTMIEMGIDPKRIISIEYDQKLYDHLVKTMPDVNFIKGDAFNLQTTLSEYSGQKFAAILSGIPLLNFKKDERVHLLNGALDWLEDEAPFVQLCYGPKPPIQISDNNIKVEPTKWILANIPPARFWIYKKNIGDV